MIKVSTIWIVVVTIEHTSFRANGYEIDSGLCGIRKVSSQRSAPGRIVGGSVSHPGYWPWQAMIQSFGEPICGAVLISDDYMLTAAHCALSGRENLTYHLGAYNREATDATAVKVNVHVIICHADYDSKTYAYDICLLKLVKPVIFTDYIQPVCLPSNETRVAVGESVTVTGWGATLGTGSNEFLNEVDVLVINTTTCRTWYDSLGELFNLKIPESHFCAGYRNGQQDSCEGDSGGPLVHNETSASQSAYVLRGITSFGYGCALKERPGVYVRVSKLTTWLDNKMEQLSGSACQPTASSACGGSVTSDVIIRSPTDVGTFDYPSNQACTWNITPPEGFRIHFEFLCYFLLSPVGGGCRDYVEIIYGEGKRQKRFCGNEIPDPYTVEDGGNATFTFVTDQSLRYPGFVTKITFINNQTTTASRSRYTTTFTTLSESGDDTIVDDTTFLYDVTTEATTSHGIQPQTNSWRFFAILFAAYKVFSQIIDRHQ